MDRSGVFVIYNHNNHNIFLNKTLNIFSFLANLNFKKHTTSQLFMLCVCVCSIFFSFDRKEWKWNEKHMCCIV